MRTIYIILLAISLIACQNTQTDIVGPLFLENINSFSPSATIEYINIEEDAVVLMVRESDSLFYYYSSSPEAKVYYQTHSAGQYAR